MGYYIDTNGNYYEGDRQYTIIDNVLIWDTEVTQKPGTNYIYSNDAWVFDKAKAITELNSKYDTILNDLGVKYSLAAGSDGTTVTTKQTAIQNQILAKISEKAIERSAILNG